MEPFVLMLVALAFAAAGASVGVMIAEWRTRAEALAEMRKCSRELEDTLKKVGLAHNSLADRIEQMQNQVTSHELKMAGSRPRSAT